LGDTIGVNLFYGEDPLRQVANGLMPPPKDDGVFVVYAHGSSNNVQYYDENGGRHWTATRDAFSTVMGWHSKEWQTAMKSGKNITVVLLSCNTGSNNYVDHNSQKRIVTPINIAQRISTFPNVTVIAPDGYCYYGGDKNGKPAILGVLNEKGNGGFRTFKNGKGGPKSFNPYKENGTGKKADGNTGPSRENNGLSREQNDATVATGSGDVKISSIDGSGGSGSGSSSGSTSTGK